MSLISQALVDLRDREAPEYGRGMPEPAILDSRVKYFSNFLWPLVFTFLLLCLLVLGHRLYDVSAVKAQVLMPEPLVKPESKSLAAATLVAESSDGTGHKQDLGLSPKNHQNADAEAIPVNAEVISVEATTISRDKREQVERVLMLAHEAISHNRLSVPRENNALYFIDKVLAKDPANSEALSLLEHVQSSFTRQLDQAIEEKTQSRAQFLMSRIDHFALAADKRKSYEVKMDTIFYALEKSKHEDNSAKQYESSVAKEIDSVDKKQSSGWVSATQASADQRALEDARSKINAHNEAAAVLSLTDFITQDSGAVKSAVFLVDFLAAKNRASQLQRVLNSLSQDHVAYVYAKAKLFTLSSRDQEAIEILQSQTPRESIKINHWGLLAGLLQKKKRYAEALKLYEGLLADDSENTTFWLGYAISLDAMERSEEALRAYLRVSHSPWVEKNIVDFVNNRVGELSRPTQQQVSRR